MITIEGIRHHHQMGTIMSAFIPYREVDDDDDAAE